MDDDGAAAPSLSGGEPHINTGLRDAVRRVWEEIEDAVPEPPEIRTDEVDAQGRTVKVTMASFARHMGIARATFQDWVEQDADPRRPDPAVQNLRRARSSLRRMAPAEQVAVIAETIAEANGDDPLALVVSLNVKRRNLTASQNAIAAAEVSLLSEKFTNADRRQLAKTFGVNERYLANARSLADRAPDLAAAVKSGAMPLAVAYDSRRSDP